MIIDFKYAYFVLTIPFIVIWILFFIFSKKTRREQLVLSILLIPLGTLGEIFYFQDYWQPASILATKIGGVNIMLEDFLFTFSIVGIGAVIYEALFAKRFVKIKKSLSHKISFPLICLLVMFVFYFLFTTGLNSIYASACALIIGALFLTSQRNDLLINSLVSGMAVVLIMFIAYITLKISVINGEILLKQGWLLHGSNLSTRIFYIPITELIWAFTYGMFIGLLYEFIKDYKVETK